MERTIFLVKLVIFSVFEDQLRIYLDKNNRLPEEGIKNGDSLDRIAKGISEKVLGISFADHYIEQLYTFSMSEDLESSIEIVYYALVPSYSIDESNLSNFLPADEAGANLRKSMRDYKTVSYAVQRLQWKIEYTNVVYSLLSYEFTLSELQTVYEAILGRSLDKRNFRKKIISLKLLQNTGKKRKGTVARPAEIYKFKTRRPQIVKVFS